MSLIDSVWEQFGSLTLDDIPPEAQRVGQQGLLDWFGCALAGSRQELAGILRAEFAQDDGPATLLGTDRRATAHLAALVNGAAGHALDYDDTNTVGGFHPSAPVLPAALAAAETAGRSGADLLTAYIVGVEVGSRFGAAIGLEHYARGWHTTSSVGIFGAAAAASRLLGLGREQFGHALGLAASQSSGVQANFGTMTKPFHAGHAAERGLVAARLASRGYTASDGAFEGTAGLLEAASTGRVNRERLDAVNDVWVMTRTLFKYHAACHGTHAAIGAALNLLTRVKAEDVVRVRVTVHPDILRVCKVVYPDSGLAGKFSLRAAVALAMLGDDTADPATFSDQRVLQPDLRELMTRIDVTQEASRVSPTSAIVVFETASGDHRATADIGTPEADLDLQERRLRMKFARLAGPVIGSDAGPLADRLLGIGAVPSVADLLRRDR
jgi:2-methylcitrate dehydratase PrpD